MKKITLFCLLALVGCVERDPRIEGARTNSEGHIHIIGTDSSADVYEITLSDGTRCAALIGTYKAGLDCDWEGSRQ